MPTKRMWLGHAPDVAQIDQIELDETSATVVAEGTDLIFKVNGKELLVENPHPLEDDDTTEPGDTSAILTLLQKAESAINSSQIPEIAELEASVESPDTDPEAPYHRLLVTTREQFKGWPFTLDVSAPHPTIDIDVVQEGGPGQNEIQQFWFIPFPTGGSYSISWDLGSGVETSGQIEFNGTANDVKAALLAMPSLGAADIEVTGSGTSTNPFVLTLGGAFAEADVDILSVDTSQLTGAGSVTITTIVQGDPGRNEQQRIQLTPTPNGGTFTLTFDGQTTGAIAFDADAATVEAELEGLSNVGSGNVTVIKPSGVWFATFQGDLAATDLPEMTGDGSSLTTSGGSLNISTLKQGSTGGYEIGAISVPVTLSGLVYFRFGGYNTPARSLLSWTQGQLLSDLAALPSIGSGNISLVGGWNSQTASFGQNKVVFAFRFQGALAGGNVGTISARDASGSFVASSREYQAGASDLADEFQVIDIRTLTSGTYTITFDGQTTGSLNFDASTSTVQAALESLSNIGSGNVRVVNGQSSSATSTARPGILLVQFQGALADTNVAQMTCTGGPVTTLHGGTTRAPIDEQQRVVVNASGGTFTLTFNGQTTNAITYGASAATVQAELEALASIGSGNAGVSGAGTPGNPYVVTFQNALGGTDVPVMTGSVGNLTGGEVIVTTLVDGEAATDEQQRIVLEGEGGSFTLSFGGQTTGDIAFPATPDSLKIALELLSSLTQVSVSGSGTSDEPFVVTFQGDQAGTNVSQMTGNAANITGGHVAAIDVVQDGVFPSGTVWDVTIHNTTSGDFTFEFLGRLTGDISFSSDAATVLAALEALAPGDFSGAWTVVDTGIDSADYRITAGGRYAGGPQKLIAHNEGLVGTALGIIHTTIQQPTGRNWIDDPVNYRDVATGLSGLPDDGDELFVQIGDAAHSMRFGSLAGVKLKRFILGSLFSGHMGLPEINPGGYAEYRPTHVTLEFEAGTQSFDNPNVLIGVEQGQGSGLVRLKTLASDEVHIRIERTGGPAEDSRPSFCWDGQNANSTLNLIEGFAGVAVFGFDDADLYHATQRGGLLRFGEGTDIGAGGFDRTGGETFGRASIGGAPVVFGN